jgi:hypothetical protein
MADTFASFAKRVDGFQKELGDDAMGHALGKMAKAEATKAASADLGGDPKFSGWKPVLDTRYDIIGPGRISFHPSRSSAGPWTVAEFGRGSSVGPSLSSSSLTPTGRVSKRRKKRNNGRTKGKGTASDALAAIDKKAPGVVDEQVGKAIRKFF